MHTLKPPKVANTLDPSIGAVAGVGLIVAALFVARREQRLALAQATPARISP